VGRPYHVPVMVAETLELLRPAAGGTIVDATFGGGGHSEAIVEGLPGTRVIAVDRDPDAISTARDLPVTAVLGDFKDLDKLLALEGIDELDGALFDLGVSSHQLDVGERGFSYRSSGPLDMRMGSSAALTADEVVNLWDRDRLADAIRRYGEERYAQRIAAAIVRARPISDTLHLAGVVADAVPARSRRSGHPARRTFQAIRIVVNDELAALAAGLDHAVRMLRPGGRIVVIAYHSLEDRIVKQRFAAGAAGCTCPPDLPVCVCEATAELRLLTRRPVRPGPDEVLANPRARSARLRGAERAPGGA
jgi:16S rRNA (cytosine1402-N4)-methyltransferase